jgi:hypothetical protein
MFLTYTTHVMKQHFIFLTIFFLVFFSDCEKNAGEPCGLEVDDSNTLQNYKILFIGNSHTYTYNIPKTIEQIAKLKGDSIITQMEAPPGYSLEQHCNRQATLDAIRSKKWDYVVLQEQGGIQALPTFMADTAFYQNAEYLADKIRENWETTKIILYMTHGYKLGVLTWNDTTWCELDPLVCDYEGMQERVKENYMALSELINAEVAPAGMMWKIIMKENENLDLFSGDNLHANSLGSYTSALTIYAVISRRTVIGAYIPANVSEEAASTIQNTVNNSLYNCNPDWRDY